MESFIEHTVCEFSKHAAPDHCLVIKHHPRDRAYRNYKKFLRRLAEQYGLGPRLKYVHDVHLPTLLDHARGTVTMNSTVGLSSLQHRTPVKVLGTAVYNIPGLTFQGSLVDFFRKPGKVDLDLYHGFTRSLLAQNQLNGSFHRRMPGVATPTGLYRRLPPQPTVDSAAPYAETSLVPGPQ
jgi:capsular polysaccharide export protein